MRRSRIDRVTSGAAGAVAALMAAVSAIGSTVTVGTALAAPEDGPRRFRCEFSAGAVQTFDKGAFVSAKAAPLSFELVDIDLDGQSAKLVATSGAAPGGVRVVRAINANHFLEVATEGFLNLTTIYDKDPVTGRYPAIHSRHFGLLGQPVYGQYTGSCEGD